MVIFMIIKGSQRSGAKQLATHLLKTEENEHVEIHEVRGFYTTNKNIHDALHEIKTLSSATNCKQFMFSVSLNPPQNEQAPIEYFDHAIEEIENRLNLKEQPLHNAVRTLKKQHQKERTELDLRQNTRQGKEGKQRANRLPKGIIKNIISRITGRYQRIQRQNIEETKQCLNRDNAERQKLIDNQLGARQKLQDKIQDAREEHNSVSIQIRKDVGQYMEMKEKNPDAKFEFTQHTHDFEQSRTL